MSAPTQMELKTGIITVPEQTKKSADKTGFLTKQGGKWKTWKKRYFVLKNNFLYYFSEPKDTVPKGVILLEGTRVNRADKDAKRKFCFAVHSRRSFTSKTGWRDRVYFFQADNETDMNQWIKAITSAAPGNPQLTEQVNKLFKASGKGDLPTVKQLLESEKVDTSCCDEDGNTALHWACVGGHIEVVKLLLQQSTDIEVKNKDGFTPLHSCAQEDRKLVMELLIASGAKLDTPNSEDNENTSLHYAACWGAVECTKLLLSKGATVDARAADKSTPLSFAAEKGHVTIARLLIEAGASLESKNDPEEKGGATPLLLAAHNGIVRLLLQKKSNIKETTIDGLNCLHLAIRSGSDNDELLRILIEGGADVNGKTNNGDTALHYAAYMGYTKSAAILIEKGASTEERGQNFSTPLHFAAREGQVDVLKLLLEKGADVTAKDKDGDTPLACSELNGFTRCMELLREGEK